MKIESPRFTESNVRSFLEETLEHERLGLAQRLENDSARLEAIIERGVRDGESEQWSGQDVLAHIVVLSKFYGSLTAQVGSGKVTEVDLLGAAQARDLAAEPLLPLPSQALLEMAQREHQRTIAYLRGAKGLDLARRANLLGGISMSAHEIATLPLCAHLEIHLEQLEQTGSG